LYSGQLAGDHVIGENLFKIKWLGNYGNINRQIPDYKIATYSASYDTDPNLPGKYVIPGGIFSTSSGRFNSKLNENVYSFSLDFIKQFDLGISKNEVKVGGFIQSRNRSFTSRTFVYKANNKSNFSTLEADYGQSGIATNGVYLEEQTQKDNDIYDANSSLQAGYMMIDNKIYDKLKLVYGVRIESFEQEVTNTSAKVSNPNELETTIIAKQNKITDILPSINTTYSLNEKFNIRVAAFRSLNRPEFREISNFGFFRFDINSDVIGNVNLKRATIDNGEIKFEFYPGPNQVISAGAFYKNINNPIELRIDPTLPFRTFRYANEKSATVYGLEFELRKDLEFLLKGFAPKIAKNFVVFSNLSFIQSKITLSEGSTSTDNRPLQGQSPYIINAGLQYDDQESGWSASAIVNQVGRRIAFVGALNNGTGQPIPAGYDIYENPRTVLDLQVSKKIKSLDFRLTLGDILAQDLVFYQDRNNNGGYDGYEQDDIAQDKTVFKYKMGYTINASVGFKF
jgi:outer membrane receptor protein involved in Fe transport